TKEPGMAMTLPTLLAMVGGVYVDRFDPRKLMLGTDLLRGAAVLLGIFAIAIPGSLVWVVIALLAINALGMAVFGPAETVMVPHMVQSEDLTAANGLYSVTSQLSSAVGSALGGAAVAAIGVGIIFGLDMASFWLSALAILLMMRTVTRPTRSLDPELSLESKAPNFRQSISEGLKGFNDIPVLKRLLPMIVLTNFSFVAAFIMMPNWIHHHLHANALWYGIVDSAWAVGAVLGGVISGQFSRMPLKKSLALFFTIEAILFLLFAASPWVVVSAAVFLLTGFANGVGNALSFTLMQRIIPPDLRGRMFGLIMTLFSLANPLGSLAAGVFLNVLPIYWSWVLAGVAGLAFVAALLRIPGALEDISQVGAASIAVE
ncbi:MAG: MFS transporter, partial [Firmicutes bacterium]|nr:MFS transporter [Bacillota bacterium]